MKRHINGFKLAWAGRSIVFAKREHPPEYEYEFIVSDDGRRIIELHSYTQPDEDENPLKKDAGKAAEEFLRLERGDE
jgi:hypothetical protein